jgi:hypothetical protein
MKFDKDTLKQLQEMQQGLLQAQEALKTETVSATAGGGVLTITLTGDQRCTAVSIDPSLLESGDVQMVQDVIMTTINQALESSRQLAIERLGPLSGGMGLG